MRRSGLIVFLGPSLRRGRARSIVEADYRPPARQGDVFRALVDRPRAIALIDGVFEGAPSVWHHELRAALASGVAVFGASSMGALRAAELAGEGMIGVGEIAARYASGEWADDADVALLHAPAELDFRAFTVPLVNVRATADAAVAQGVLAPRVARALVRAATDTFYQQRRWPRVLDRWRAPAATRRRFAAWLESNEVDLKARDAEACLRVARDFLRSRVPSPVGLWRASSFVRRQRLVDAHAATLARLRRRADAGELEEQGVRRLLLASFARLAGLQAPPAEVADIARTVAPRGLSEDQRCALAETLALEALVLAAPERFVADGPSRLEGLALEAQVRGLWAPAPRRRRASR